jgi:urea transport system ATP-binding protein
MTPELMRQGAERRAAYEARMAAVAAAGARRPRGGFGRPLQRLEPVFTQGVALYVDEVTVSFDGFKALNALSLQVAAGELRCIIGPNGAGKTTMMDCITGKTRPDSGRIGFGSNLDVLRLNETEIVTAGIGRKFQKPTVYERLTVLDNLAMSLAGPRSVRASLSGHHDGAENARLDELLGLIELEPAAHLEAGTLSHGQKQWLEIGMLLAQDPKLLLLDEPVAGMTDEETERTAELFLSLEGQHSLVVVEHDMKFVAALAGAHRKVTVLHEGSVLAEGRLADVQADSRVVEVYLGR